jgi:hypothetical protein
LVNGTPIGQGFGGVHSPGIYVNAEPIMKRYIERNFNGNMEGNLYEIEHHDDFVRERLDFISVEDLSKVENKADLKFAMDHIAANGLAGANQMLDLDQFIKFYAMEFFLKHWDGYADNTNNTYLYNDVDAVDAPGVDNVKFKMVPWGLDQTFQPDRSFKLGTEGLIARLVREDGTRRAQVLDQIRTYRDTVFSRESQQTVLKPLINQMEALLVGFGVPNAVSEIATVRQQLRLAESAGYLCAGLPSSAVYILNEETNECLHASNTLVTPQGHKYLYTCAPNNTDHAEEFLIVPSGSVPADFRFTGYFRLASGRTNLRATYGSDLTPGGRARVHQEAGGSRLYFY